MPCWLPFACNGGATCLTATARGEIPDAPIGRALQAARLRIEDLHELVDAREAFIAEDGDKGEAAARAGRALIMLALEIFNLDAAVLGELAAQGGEGFERLRAAPDETSIGLCRDLLNAACLGFNRLPVKQRKAALPVFFADWHGAAASAGLAAPQITAFLSIAFIENGADRSALAYSAAIL